VITERECTEKLALAWATCGLILGGLRRALVLDDEPLIEALKRTGKL
jgi:hypothetical protein